MIKRKRRDDKEKKRERDSFEILFTGYLSSIVKIEREIEREREGDRERKSNK